jgi:ABC-type dipeptide/oligopeptide/nickel transport system permease subunit
MFFTITIPGGATFGLLMFTTGFLLIPSFTRIIANAEFRPITIGKKIISYVPLFAGFAILLYVSLGFLGFSDWRQIQLGNLINIGRERLWDITHFPHAVFWPGAMIFFILIGLFVLHEGLAKSSR